MINADGKCAWARFSLPDNARADQRPATSLKRQTSQNRIKTRENEPIVAVITRAM